jgi:hypothetical protein
MDYDPAKGAVSEFAKKYNCGITLEYDCFGIVLDFFKLQRIGCGFCGKAGQADALCILCGDVPV